MSTLFLLVLAAVFELVGCIFMHRYILLTNHTDLLIGTVVLIFFGLTLGYALPNDLPRTFVYYGAVYLAIAAGYAVWAGMTVTIADFIGFFLLLGALFFFWFGGRI